MTERHAGSDHPISTTRSAEEATSADLELLAPDDAGAGEGIDDDRERSQPRISIIIPTLNEEKLLASTLAAFPRELRWRHGMELIVSDGGSRDRTVEIARAEADVVVEHHEERRQTIAEGRNRGGERGRGEILVFINADTVPRDGRRFLAALERLSHEWSQHQEEVAIACPVEVAPGERRLSDRLFHGFFNNYVRLLNGIGLGMGRGECQVIRRSAFRRAGGYNHEMAAGEDFDLYKRLRQFGRIGHSDDLRVYESPRRFRRYGYLRVVARWTMNGLAVLLLRRSVSTEWEEVR